MDVVLPESPFAQVASSSLHSSVWSRRFVTRCLPPA